jgi:hypothetical protein
MLIGLPEFWPWSHHASINIWLQVSNISQQIYSELNMAIDN